MSADASLAGSSVVVPAIGSPSSIACLRSLGSAGVHTIAISEQDAVAGFYSTHCEEAIVVPDPGSDLLGYRDALVDLANRPDVRTIIPVREADVYLLSRYRDTFERAVSIPVPPFEMLRRVHDRLELAAAADEAGVPHPETRPLSALEDWSTDSLVKSRYNILADAYVDTLGTETTLEVDLIEHVEPGEKPDPDALREAMGHEPIVQEYVPGDEYMVGALYDHGDPVATVQHHQVRGMSYVGAGGVYRESIHDPELEGVARELLDHLEWHGLACLEYMRDTRTGEYKLAEINPRAWQSLAANVAMGADFPRYYWNLAIGREEVIEPSDEVGVGCHWLKGEFLHLLSLFRDDSPLVTKPGRLSTLADIATSIGANPRFDYLSRDDPLPFVQDWWALLCAVPGVPEVAIPGVTATTWEKPGVGERRRSGMAPSQPVADGDPSGVIGGPPVEGRDHQGYRTEE